MTEVGDGPGRLKTNITLTATKAYGSLMEFKCTCDHETPPPPNVREVKHSHEIKPSRGRAITKEAGLFL